MINIQNDKDEFLIALLQGSHRKCSKIASKYSASHDAIKVLYDLVIKPALYRVGEMWEFNLISVASEHLATSLSESIMNELYEGIISDERTNQSIVLACVENEYHQVGVKMVADIFEMNGWDSYFVGASTPTSELISFAKEINPQIIALSLSIYSHLNYLEPMLQKLRATFSTTPILVGGQGFLHGGVNVVAKYENVHLFNTIEEIQLFINKSKIA